MFANWNSGRITAGKAMIAFLLMLYSLCLTHQAALLFCEHHHDQDYDHDQQTCVFCTLLHAVAIVSVVAAVPAAATAYRRRVLLLAPALPPDFSPDHSLRRAPPLSTR